MFILFSIILFVFHCSITVVQSYFIYWAGIESPLLRDGSRSPWSSRNLQEVGRWNLFYSQLQGEDTVLQGKKVLRG